MTQLKQLMLGIALGGLAIGVSGHNTAFSQSGDVVIAADDASPAGTPTGGDPGSAKMGTEEGTHTGANQGSKPENDTSKIDQPPRRDPTTGGDATGQ
jgi:hypothetical protein